ncbi:protein S100-A13-like [Protopterus annectens]|uniref:protein S100-A13-like n=1 Tax=Protopterus annectens TaxID=7888 RepID=UPI001CFA70BD|nr:protein S100-A13-like [Protopterus annectens]XP_043935894.1 protein S100-A13-like [Protopterus annectens]
MAGHSECEKALTAIVEIFLKYASKEGKKDKLSNTEFRNLVRDQLPHLIEDPDSTAALMKSLDRDKDNELKFKEFWKLIGKLAWNIKEQRASKGSTCNVI